ncbi:Uu.00g015940.m01.CDS01 [Anthostomella pinea]|uniref:Uu.00g015940.m01.CDS01 n=1 Tax=Anthostomella pinea TaxID=933095 RepID=A0AAI8YQH6_9PEZI|nr:Uu.00g015940.m01.CDS01 [Anthostomella pinea]
MRCTYLIALGLPLLGSLGVLATPVGSSGATQLAQRDDSESYPGAKGEELAENSKVSTRTGGIGQWVDNTNVANAQGAFSSPGVSITNTLDLFGDWYSHKRSGEKEKAFEQKLGAFGKAIKNGQGFVAEGDAQKVARELRDVLCQGVDKNLDKVQHVADNFKEWYKNPKEFADKWGEAIGQTEDITKVMWYMLAPKE